MTLLLTLGAGTALALSLYVARQREGWAARGITPLGGWRPVSLLQVAVAVTAAAWFGQQWGSGAAISAAAFGWLGVLAVATDLKTRKIPWDVSHPVAAAGLACFAFNYTTEGLLALLMALAGLVGIPLAARALTNKGLGMSDVRLLWAATATTSWWAGQTWLLYGLILAALIQILVRVAARPCGWGRMVPASGHATPGDPTGRLRLELPFAPALVLALATCLSYGTATGLGACAMWNVTGAC